MKRALIVAFAVILLVGSLAWAINCPKCGKEIQPNSKFCPGCGNKIEFGCPGCKNKIHFGDKFCPKCGKKLAWPGGPVKPPTPPPTPPAPAGASMSSADIFAAARSAVVRVDVKNKAGQKTGSGSGFLVSADGHVVTNYHVIDEAWSATVVTDDKKQHPVIGYAAVEPEHDLAVLRINAKGLPFLTLAPAVLPRVGTKVVSIGFPLGLPLSLSEGIVSGQPELAGFTGKKIQFVQTTAPISPGSSGGPLLSGYGKVLVVGVTAASRRGGQNLNLAIPAARVREILSKKGTLRRLPPPKAQIVIPPAPTTPKLPERKFTDPFDKEVQKGIDRAVTYLWSTCGENGTWPPVSLNLGATKAEFPVGPTALVCYALLESGVSPQDKRMARILRWLSRQKTTKTYTLGLRANVWCAAYQKDKKYHEYLVKDVENLIKGTRNGSYTYDCVANTSMGMVGDNSNSQYGLLGVWAGAKGDMEIPARYWKVVADHWKKCQDSQGGWGYHERHRAKSYPSMSVAGLASLYVCNENLLADKFSKCGQTTEDPAVKRGLAWLEKTMGKIGLDSLLEHQGGRVLRMPLDTYYLFGVERVALASGYKYFGKLNWYREGATRMLKAQRPNGMVPSMVWGDANVATAYALLYLVRGRHPVIFNKLKFNSDWNNRPRDLSSLTRWMSKTFERTVNWQIIALDNPVVEWHDAPILYISGAKDPKFADKDIDTLRTFVHQGGTIFSCTECSGGGFKTGIRKAYAQMFPTRKLTPMPPKHEMFNIHFKVPGTHFFWISNGIRPTVIHVDYDLPLSWQERRVSTRKWTYQVAANIAMYVTGKGAFHPRGITHWPADKSISPVKTVKLARLKHSGNFDPEPLAYTRFARLLAQRNKMQLDVAGPMSIADLSGSGAKLATLTGTEELSLSAADKKALKAFAEAGGTILIDAAGGSATFDTSAQKMLYETFGMRPRALASTAALFNQKGMEITRVRYRGPAKTRLARTTTPTLRAIAVQGRPAVLYSREDITGGLVGYESTTCGGYDPDSAFEILRNIVSHAAK